MSSPAIEVEHLRHSYGEHRALNDVTFDIPRAEIFGLLGPNGGGKTTLFRLLSTLLPVQQGTVRILGIDVATAPAEVRPHIGVTFQSPSLDDKLTVAENLKHQGHLYGLSGKQLRDKSDRLLAQLGVGDRRLDRVGSLSGGLKRRVEIAKGLLHDPTVLLLDEPSTGLDPGARHDLWRYLRKLRDEQRVTILVTTHLMEEAEHCDRLGILDKGVLVALDTPANLRSSIGGECLDITGERLDDLAVNIEQRFHIQPIRIGNALRIQDSDGLKLLTELMPVFGEQIQSVSLGQPTLEDVFIDRTGHRFWDEPAAAH